MSLPCVTQAGLDKAFPHSLSMGSSFCVARYPRNRFSSFLNFPLVDKGNLDSSGAPGQPVPPLVHPPGQASTEASVISSTCNQ